MFCKASIKSYSMPLLSNFHLFKVIAYSLATNRADSQIIQSKLLFITLQPDIKQCKFNILVSRLYTVFSSFWGTHPPTALFNCFINQAFWTTMRKLLQKRSVWISSNQPKAASGLLSKSLHGLASSVRTVLQQMSLSRTASVVTGAASSLQKVVDFKCKQKLKVIQCLL